MKSLSLKKLSFSNVIYIKLVKAKRAYYPQKPLLPHQKIVQHLDKQFAIVNFLVRLMIISKSISILGRMILASYVKLAGLEK